MIVELVDYMGSDASVVNAARVSFDKEASYYSTDQNDKLIRFLATHNHFSPFCHAFVSFRIKAPLFVAAQLKKHQVGLAWNEISRRYVDVGETVYTPKQWRERASNKKQGSKNTPIKRVDVAGLAYSVAVSVSKLSYRLLLKLGVAPEQARMVLPQSTNTLWIWSGSLYAFARICNLRLKEDAQAETREVAQQIYEHMVKLFPVSMKELVN